jgi:hypothetical protein
MVATVSLDQCSIIQSLMSHQRNTLLNNLHLEILSKTDHPKIFTVETIEGIDDLQNKVKIELSHTRKCSTEEEGGGSRQTQAPCALEEGSRSFTLLNARRVPSVKRSLVDEESLNLSSMESSGKSSLKDRMMPLPADPLDQHVDCREDRKRSVSLGEIIEGFPSERQKFAFRKERSSSLGEIIEDFPPQERRSFLVCKGSKQTRNTSSNASARNVSSSESSTESKAIHKSSIFMKQQEVGSLIAVTTEHKFELELQRKWRLEK